MKTGMGLKEMHVFSFKRIYKDFLGNQKAANYQDVVQDRLSSYSAMGCNISPKIHFLESLLDFFPENLGEVSDERGDIFHQTVPRQVDLNPLNAELNFICHLLVLLGAHPILHISRIRVKYVGRLLLDTEEECT